MDEQDRIVFTVIGRIQAEQVSEQQALLKSGFAHHKLVLDLEEVKLVDRDADDTSVASYRSLLEDNLAALSLLEQEA